MTEPTEPNDLAQRGAQAIAAAFAAYHIEFRAITRRARASFERCDWQSGQQDAVERLELYTLRIDGLIEELHALLDDQVKTAALWNAMKRCYAGLTAARDDVELAETFFNSATRRIFATIGVDHAVEFVAPAEERRPRSRSTGATAATSRPPRCCGAS